MSLQVVACPETESDVALAVCLLDAHRIPHLVHGGAFGALFPGPQIATYNARRILVPEALADEARDILAELAAPAPLSASVPAEGTPGVLRLFLEFLLLGWFVPRRGVAPTDEPSR